MTKRVLFYVHMISKSGLDHFSEDFNPISKELTCKCIPHWVVNRSTQNNYKEIYDLYKPTDVFFRLPSQVKDISNFFRKNGCNIHGVLHGWPVGNNTSHYPMYLDKLYTWGSLSSKFYTDKGDDPKKFIITGSPKFDTLYNKLGGGKKVFNKIPTIGYASTPYHIWKQNNYMSESIEYARSVYNISEVGFPRIKHRPHPVSWNDKEWVDNFKNEVRNSRRSNGSIEISNPSSESLADWISDVDILITTQSGVSIEAASIGIPIVSMRYFGRETYVPAIEEGLAIRSSSSADLQDKIIEAYYSIGKINPNVKKFQKYFDGKCSERIVRNILK